MKLATLEEELEAATIHVAGHIVARRRLGIRDLEDAPVSIKVPLVRKAHVCAARVTMPKNGVSGPAAAKYLVACYVGLEAEARWLEGKYEVSRRAARRIANSADRGNEKACIRRAGRISNISRRTARRRANHLVSKNRPAIERLAEDLWDLAGGEGLEESAAR